MRNSFILYHNIKRMVNEIWGIENLIVESSNLELKNTLSVMLEKMHKITKFEGKERNSYTLLTWNHPTIKSICARAVYIADKHDYFYTVIIDYKNGDELYISPDLRRKYIASMQDYNVFPLGDK